MTGVTDGDHDDGSADDSAWRAGDGSAITTNTILAKQFTTNSIVIKWSQLIVLINSNDIDCYDVGFLCNYSLFHDLLTTEAFLEFETREKRAVQQITSFFFCVSKIISST